MFSEVTKNVFKKLVKLFN